MEEKEALLYGEPNRLGNYQRSRVGNDEDDLSSEDSDEWWNESESSCSSCNDDHSHSSLDWEKEVMEDGQLFYIESDVVDTRQPINGFQKSGELSVSHENTEKPENMKSRRILNWMRRKEGKKTQTNKGLDSEESQAPEGNSGGMQNTANKEIIFKDIIFKVNTLCQGTTVCEKLLGLSLGVTKENEVVVTNTHTNVPTQNVNDVSIGDIVHKINNYNVTPQNVEMILQSLNFPCEVTLKIQKLQDSPAKKIKFQSQFVQSLLQPNQGMDTVLLNEPVGIVVVDVESQNLNKDDVIYCYPDKCTLSSCRGAFVTLYHLLSEIKPNDMCQSSSIVMKKQKAHVLYMSDENFLLLIAIPQAKCSLKESTYIVNDLVRNLLFTHQTLKRCFETAKKSVLDHFFSLFFSGILSNGSLGNEPATADESPPLPPVSNFSLFEDVMPYATWMPLPKEAQLQIDEALNELEANDFDIEVNENIENRRNFNIVGSCLFHKGYLLSSHLSKEDLLDVYAFYRQNFLLSLFRNEPVKSLVIWREVYPLSANRGLPVRKPGSFALPTGRWFMLTVGQGYDSLTVILVSAEFCTKIEANAGPSVAYVEEVEDTLRHMQKLGISTLASQWMESNSRFRTTTPEEIFTRRLNRKKENLLGFVKTFDGVQKTGPTKASPPGQKSGVDAGHVKRPRSAPLDTSEDSVSQTPSNVSEVSDENAPILGRRGERARTTTENLSDDSDSSDSDWDSSRDSNVRGSISSGGIDNFYLCDVGEILPARLTTGTEDLLLYYVHMDGAEGVLVNPPTNSKRSTPKMREILANFRKCSQIIHSILENNIKFKKNSQDYAKCYINKSLVAVKEHGVVFECFSSEAEYGRKPVSFTYWIVGRLFFTPAPREIYVCYNEEAPQNLVEMAFRLGLSVAG